MYRTITLPALLLSVSALALSACAPPAENIRIEDRSADGATAFGAGGEDPVRLQTLDAPPDDAFAIRIVYFAYDSSVIEPQFKEIIQAHAAYLARHPRASLALEGHADERGSREYNLALGERRSLTVKQQLVLLGAGAAQIRATSYGEERPAAGGHNERAWARNRRVELLYQ